MSEFDLNQFLAQQSSEGSSHGVGDFTISVEKAAQKMTQYSLPREHAWVLKFVQAAVAWKCTGLRLSQGRTDSTFHFEFQDRRALPSQEQVITSLLRSDFESAAPVDHLGAALRVVVEKAHLSFMLGLQDGHGEMQSIYAGVYFAEIGEKRRATKRESWVSALTVAIHHISHTETNRLLLSYISVKRHGLPMIGELESRAYSSPIPITVDGRRIDGVLRSSELNWNHYRKPLRLSGLRVDDKEFAKLTLSSSFTNRVLTLHSDLERHSETEPETSVSSFYFLLALVISKDAFRILEPANHSKICWVRDGVIVDEQILHIKTIYTHLTLYAPAEGLRPDLTGFQLIRNSEYRERCRKILTRMSGAMGLEILAKRDIFSKDEELESELHTKEAEDLRPPHSADGGTEQDSPLELLSSGLAVISNLAVSAYDRFRRELAKGVRFDRTVLEKRYPRELQLLADGLEGSLEPKQETLDTSELRIDVESQGFEWAAPERFPGPP